jgi:hypothetical protein
MIPMLHPKKLSIDKKSIALQLKLVPLIRVTCAFTGAELRPQLTPERPVVNGRYRASQQRHFRVPIAAEVGV